MTGKHKHMEAELECFDDHSCISWSEESKCMWTHSKVGATWARGAFTTFTFFRSRKTSVIVETFQISFCVCSHWFSIPFFSLKRCQITNHDQLESQVRIHRSFLVCTLFSWYLISEVFTYVVCLTTVILCAIFMVYFELILN